MEEKAVLTPKNICGILNISLPLCYRQLKAGIIPSVKCGDLYIISRKAFYEWLEGKRQPCQSVNPAPACAGAQP